MKTCKNCGKPADVDPNAPREYDLDKPEEVSRWFREMEAYLRVDNFTEHGTDREGRVFAARALVALKDRIPALASEVDRIRGEKAELQGALARARNSPSGYSKA